MGDAQYIDCIKKGKMKAICILGCTGVGKSSLGNTLSTYKIFKVSADIKSETDETQGVITYVNYNGKNRPTLMIDTPGFGDTEGRDSVFTARMILCLKSLKYVNAFIVCLNSQESRIDLNKQGYIKLLGQMFGGQKFYKHVLICFTKWEFDKAGRLKREHGLQMTEQDLVRRYIEEFKNKLGIQLNENQFAFVNNTYAIKGLMPKDKQAVKDFKENIQKIYTFCMSDVPFNCKDIEKVEDENQLLKDALHQALYESRQRLSEFEQMKMKLETQNTSILKLQNEITKLVA